MLKGRRSRPPRAREYIAVWAVGRLLPFEAVLAKSPGRAAADVRASANGDVTYGRGSSFGKYPLSSRSLSATFRSQCPGLRSIIDPRPGPVACRLRQTLYFP